MDERTRKEQCRRFAENIRRDKYELGHIRTAINSAEEASRRYANGVRIHGQELRRLRQAQTIAELGSNFGKDPKLSAIRALTSQAVPHELIRQVEESLEQSERGLKEAEQRLRQLRNKRDELTDFIAQSHKRRRELRCDDEL